MTIQFPHWISGESQGGGIIPIAIAGHHIQIAVPIPRVSVGVTKIRKKLVGSHVQRIHPALGRFHRHVLESPIGEGGYVDGIGIHHHGP